MNNPIIFDWKTKQAAHWLLQRKWLIRNPLYLYVYRRKVARDMARYEDRPLRVRLGNTNVCPADCAFCPHGTMKRKQGFMDMKLYKRLVDECAEWGVPEVVVQEFGEPFTDKDFFERVRYAKEKGIGKVQTNANCRYITPEKHLAILESGLDELFISCNKEGWFNVVELCKLKVCTGAKTPKIYLSGIHGYYIPKKIKGVSGVSISYPHNWAGKVSVGSPVTFFRDPCKLLWVTMYVAWNGIVHLCCMDYEAEYYIGDANKEGLRDIWQSLGSWSYKSNIQMYRDFHIEGRYDMIGVCKDCVYNRHDKFNWWL